MWRKSEDAKIRSGIASESKPRSIRQRKSATPAAASLPTAATVSRGVIIKGEISGEGTSSWMARSKERAPAGGKLYGWTSRSRHSGNAKRAKSSCWESRRYAQSPRAPSHLEHRRLTGNMDTRASSSKMAPSCTAK